METLIENILKWLPTILTGLFLYYWQRQQKSHDDIKAEAEKVSQEIQNATMELSYATSIAVSEGKTNGELKRAREAYQKAVKHRDELGQKLIQKQK